MPRPCCLVINTDPGHKPGAHWLAVYISGDGVIDYFDSYGFDPSIPSIVSWIEKPGELLNVNKLRVQSVMSAACGQHCIHYLLMRSRGFDMCAVMGMLSDPVGGRCIRKKMVMLAVVAM